MNRIRYRLLALITGFFFCIPILTFADLPSLTPRVEIEEDIYTFNRADKPDDNCASPLWARGSISLVRVSDQVFASGLERLPDVRPLNNCQCKIWQRGLKGWDLVYKDEGRTLEPCPLVAFPITQDFFLSSNPTVNKPEQSGGGPAQPVILQFSAANPRQPPKRFQPTWQESPMSPPFREHSYRSFVADSTIRELILFQNIDYTHAEWTFRDRDGHWAATGQLRWPWGGEYDPPRPVRLAYPVVALQDRVVYFVGASDIIEPYEPWKAFKREQTGREWDYVFRRLFYTWSPDITKGQFQDWVEIANREKTGGLILPGDLWIAPDNAAHVVWEERALDERLRKAFFPEAKQRIELNYAVLREGKVILRRTLLAVDEGKPSPIPHLPRFQVTPENRLFVFFYVDGRDESGKAISENRILEILQDGTATVPVRVPLKYPLNSSSNYFTATVRGGSQPSRILDLLGTRVSTPATISYARVRLY